MELKLLLETSDTESHVPSTSALPTPTSLTDISTVKGGLTSKIAFPKGLEARRKKQQNLKNKVMLKNLLQKKTK
jgi:hypothetical protein